MLKKPGTSLSARAGIKEVLAQKAKRATRKAFEIEARGRKLASERDALIGIDDIMWLSDLEDIHYELDIVVDTLRPILSGRVDIEAMRFMYLVARHLIDAAHDLRYKLQGKPRSVHFLNPSEVDMETINLGWKAVEELERYNDAQSRLTGKSGLWLWGRVKPEEYSWSAFLNDVTACYHLFIDYFARTVGEYVSISAKVYAHIKANPHAVELAEKWEEATDVLNDRDLYEPQDYEALTAVVLPTEIQFRVGSMAGHMTHVVLKPLGYEVIYYDWDDYVRLVLGRLAVDFGCRIIQDVPQERIELFCPSLTGASDSFIKYVLPFATSMDFRIGDPEKYWKNVLPADYMKELEGMPQEDIEYHACKWFIENVLKKELG